MTRTIILGALAAIAIGFTAPAQAHMANPALGAATSGNIEQAQYFYFGPRRSYHRRHHWRRGYAWYPRRCWTERIRTWNGHIRYVRRCR